MLWKTVTTVAVVTVKTDAATYKVPAPVTISGTVAVDGAPSASTPVVIVVTDFAGTATTLPGLTTGPDGTFTIAWPLPTTIAPGVASIDVTALGITATVTFILTTQSLSEYPCLNSAKYATPDGGLVKLLR